MFVVGSIVRLRTETVTRANATTAATFITRKLAGQPIQDATYGVVSWPTANPAGALVTNTPMAVPRLTSETIPPIRLVDAVQITPTATPATRRDPSRRPNAPSLAASQLQMPARNTVAAPMAIIR